MSPKKTPMQEFKQTCVLTLKQEIEKLKDTKRVTIA